MPFRLGSAMRIYVPWAALLAVLLFPFTTSAADGSMNGNEYNGAWTGWKCPAGIRPSSGKCASFVLLLYQKQDRVCGSHMYATAGASSLDEGGIPSFTGKLSNGAVDGMIESGLEPGRRIHVELKLAGDRLQWKRLENPEGNYLLPVSMQMTRSKHGSLFHPVFEQQLSASCTASLNRALEANRQGPQQGAQGTQGAQGEQRSQ